METLRKFDERMRICFVAPDIYPVLSREASATTAGGAEVQQAFLSRGLRDLGFRITVVTNVPDVNIEFDLDGLRIVPILRHGKEIPVIRNVHPRLTSVWVSLRKAKADIYYQRCAGPNTFVTGLFSKYKKCKFVYSGASDPDFDRDQLWRKFPGRGGWRDRKLYEYGLRLADGIVAQHRGQVQACRNWYRRDAVEIPNCYAPPATARSDSTGVVLWVATVKSLKRPELFLELARRLPKLRFRMVGGPGPGAEAEVFSKIEKAAATLPNVEFVGFVPFVDVEAHFDAARVFVNTSDYEGFPNTFLQSWARGVPTVSFFDCGAREGGCPVGYIANDIDDMANTIDLLSEDDGLWAQEGHRAKQYFEANHSVDIAVKKYMQLFDQVLSQRGGP